jgi:hypothetical protein
MRERAKVRLHRKPRRGNEKGWYADSQVAIDYENKLGKILRNEQSLWFNHRLLLNVIFDAAHEPLAPAKPAPLPPMPPPPNPPMPAMPPAVWLLPLMLPDTPPI